MEEGQNTENQATEQEYPQETPVENTNNVSFPTVGQQKKSGGAKTFLILATLILVAILGFVIYKSAVSKSANSDTEPTPFDNLTTPSTDTTTVTETATPVATTTSKPADKSKVIIEIQNGTGISGEALYLENQLKALGYTNIKVGNASSQNLTDTEVTFSKTLSSTFVDEITAKLKTIYQSVKVVISSSTTSTTDVLIVTGLRKDSTPKPTASASATPVATSTP